MFGSLLERRNRWLGIGSGVEGGGEERRPVRAGGCQDRGTGPGSGGWWGGTSGEPGCGTLHL